MANSQKTQSNDQASTTSNTAQSNTQNKPENKDAKNQSTGSSSQLSEQVGGIVSGGTGAIKDVLSQAKESTGQVASQAYGIAAKKATSAIDEQKANLAQGLTSVADNIRQLGANKTGQDNPIAGIAAKYSDSVAGQVEQIGRYLDGKDLRQMATDVEKFARRNPAVFLGGAFALGLLAARFLKSGNPNQALMRRERYEREGVYLPDESEGVHLPENLDDQVKSASKQNDFSSGTTGAKTSAANLSSATDSSIGKSGITTGANDKTTGTGGAANTANTTKGSSNQGG
jgi:hypothetical protein